ncbi:GDSL esterase/lipase At1g28570-like isoform X3 [Olea europaea var. sylvestris]|uniref:GDSL esterase/lipase At1g28570-like isoform X3 n=1 Tax=Olea europaea var. sylvestris TaxID=158386 RepID=UPI000C1D30AF|nr:GDSL esterase/lipase At1g28570-like isoform X3 [Olea europaea var. sylvestris]
MASNISPLKNAFACAVLFLLSASKYACGCYKSIISFGDSLADTGNLLYLESTSSNEKPPSGFLPYGETFFHHPTGRFSDGRLIIDFIAQDMGLPFVPPFHGEGNVSRRNYRKGVNFAVGGSTALEDSFFAKIGVKIPYANVSLAAQLSWFKEFLSTICHKPSNYDNAAMSIYLSLDKYGFTKGTLTACCGGEGPFNVSLTVHCGASGSTTCEDPSKYVS